MDYIRSRETQRTCIQESAPVMPETDVGTDFVCVYGFGGNMEERIREYRRRGYRIHMMTGIAWGNYLDYLNGEWDGRNHWDETQKSRDGSMTGGSIHETGYMVPTIAYTNYLIENLKRAVDAGAEAIHVEEPEFLNDGGYSEAFKREYLLYYHEPWQPPHTSADAHYRAARLKAYLYRRAIDRVSAALQEYALTVYGRTLRFYVPTHSLLNYATWKVMSPEGTMTDIPTLNGYKAQIWMGTAREANVYHGVYKERTLETAFLEYGVMQELVRGTEREMWFDNDPIEDRPDYTWQDYRENYHKTLVGSLLQPYINRFQVAPWPHRIFEPGRTYPSGKPDAKPMPEAYRTELMNLFQFLGTLGTDDFAFSDETPGIGVFLSDTAMFQRSFPDDALARRGDYAPVGPIELRAKENYAPGRESALASGDRLAFYESLAFPLFYGMALPLLKVGVPVRPVQLENAARYPGYLDPYRLLLLSYEFMKPLDANANAALASFARDGGTLVYVGDGADPFHQIRGWWNTGRNVYPTPLEHLLSLFGLPENAAPGVYPYGKGCFVLRRESPADLCVDPKKSDAFRDETLSLIGMKADKNRLALRRGAYRITAVFDESVSDAPYVHRGRLMDLLEPDLPVVPQKTVRPGENAVLLDLDLLGDEPQILGTSLRALSFTSDENGFRFEGTGARCEAVVRLKLPAQPKKVVCELSPYEGEARNVSVTAEWEALGGSVLLRFHNDAGKTTLTGSF